MAFSSRITDAVDFFHQKGDLKSAVKVVRDREPEPLRWRNAVGTLTEAASEFHGLERMRVEEPVREIITEISDAELRREVVLDARKFGMDLDRGEFLPSRSVADVMRYCFLANTDINFLKKFVRVAEDLKAPVDTAAVTVIARSIAEYHRKRANHLFLQIPDEEDPEPYRPHHEIMASRAQHEKNESKKWSHVARCLIEDDNGT